jgi:Holliday junction resolvase RusA-like endonuclease
MTMMVMYTVYGEPVGKGRPRFARNGNFVSTYTHRRPKTYEDEIRMMAKAAMGIVRATGHPCNSSNLYQSWNTRILLKAKA